MPKIEVLGYEMTTRQKEELLNLLTADILNRYDNLEYWDQNIITEFAHNKKLKEA